jgi:hypothetical protein
MILDKGGAFKKKQLRWDLLWGFVRCYAVLWNVGRED